jgi:uracil-DNA glycosylase
VADSQALIQQLQAQIKRCKRCPDMHRPVVVGNPVVSPVMLVGQAPGHKEIEIHKPFAWTAGKTLFKWFAQTGLDEEQFRQRVYMAAVCRCFPGKNPKGGDRVPSGEEVANCSTWLQAELKLLKPGLIIPAGKLAIAQFMPVDKLDMVIGKKYQLQLEGFKTDVIPLPHPSGASTWHRMEPGKTLLTKALRHIRNHPAWRQILDSTT